MRYRWQISGQDSRNNCWSTSGTLPGPYKPGEFDIALSDAQMQAFMQLTAGKALFGRPGVACRGPYRITRLQMEEVSELFQSSKEN